MLILGLAPTDPRLVECARIFDECLGTIPNRLADLKAAAPNPNRMLCVINTGPRVVAAARASVLTGSEVEIAAQRWDGVFPPVEAGEMVGSLTAVGVLSRFRRRGLGSTLLEARLEWLRTKGVSLVVVESWRSGTDESAPLLSKAGFVTVASREGFWADTVNDDSPCPDCGSVCVCVADLMALRL